MLSENGAFPRISSLLHAVIGVEMLLAYLRKYRNPFHVGDGNANTAFALMPCFQRYIPVHP